ncbi:zinc finger protein 239-like [Sycon ciliatum]|uniref:zinc finger protein 239-like n=1 Tax=Sycon ciliatum TaxID=27933 RepID=UPI0031F70A6E
MEYLEDSISDCSVDSNDLPPMPPLMKSKRTKLNRTSREHGPSSIPPSPASNLLEENMEKPSCMRSASLENREDTSSIPLEFTSSTIPVSPPPLIKWTIPSASISNRQPAFEQAFQIADKSQRDEATSSAQSEMEEVVNWTSTFSGREKHASPVKPPLQFEIDGLTPATASNTGVFGGRTPDLWEQADAFGMSVERRHPIGQHSEPSKVVAQNQDSYKSSKCKTLQRCQFCQKEFKYVSRLREHERVHTGDRPFKCDVCEKSFTQSGSLCAHKRTHTGDRPFKCDLCGMSFSYSGHLCAHKRTHTGDRPFKCDVCGKSFTQSGNLCDHKHTHTGERPHKCKKCGKSFAHSSNLRRHKRIHS